MDRLPLVLDYRCALRVIWRRISQRCKMAEAHISCGKLPAPDACQELFDLFRRWSGISCHLWIRSAEVVVLTQYAVKTWAVRSLLSFTEDQYQRRNNMAANRPYCDSQGGCAPWSQKMMR